MISFLIDVRMKPHVDVVLLLQCDWILERSVKLVVRRLNGFRCCNWHVCIHRVQVLQLACLHTSCLFPGVRIAQCGKYIIQRVEFTICIPLVTGTPHFYGKRCSTYYGFFSDQLHFTLRPTTMLHRLKTLMKG